ncbi:MAG: efflux RND transporter periplasmic adaptor subunit [Limisphaerales bacterium]
MNSNPLRDRLPTLLRRRPWLILAAVVALVLLFVWLRPRATSDVATSYFEVRRGEFTVSVVEGGNLSAVSEVSMRNEVEGTARIIYIVPEGTYVKKDDLLVELDSAQAQDQVNQQQINLEKARLALTNAQTQLEIQMSTTNSEIRAAALKVKFAEMDVRKFLEGQKEISLIESRNKLVTAASQLEVSYENFINSSNLAAKGYETKSKLDQDRLGLMTGQNSLIVASNSMQMLEKYEIPKQYETFVSAHEEAGKELDRVILQAERRVTQYKADLLSQSNTLRLSQNKLERDLKNLDATKIYARQDGLVVYAISEGRFSSESLIEEGATVRNRQELIKLPDVSRMKVTIKVHESHIGMIRVGQPAYVVLDSMPDVRFRGVVDKVGLLPDTQSRFGNPNLKVYNTDVVVIDPLPDIKPGVSARAEVIVTNIADALSVPIQAVTTLGGKQVCYLANRGNPTPVPVMVGMFNTKFIEILSGVKEGDRVLLSPPFDTQEKDLDGAVLADGEKPPASATNTAIPAPVPAAVVAPPDRAGSAPIGIVSTAPGVARTGGPNAAAGGGRGNRLSPEEMLKQFDKDGDGELSETEREAMREEMRSRFGGQGQGQGPGQGRGPGAGAGTGQGQGGDNGGGERPARRSGGREAGGGDRTPAPQP